MSPVAEGVELRELEIHGVKLDVCPKSGGIWFDRFEMKHFDEAHEDAGLELYELPYDPDFFVDHQAKRRSPRHPDIVMQRQIYGHKQEVEVDVCPMCGGIWLDRGELQAIRDLYPDASLKQETEDKIAEQYLYNHPMAKEIVRENTERLEKARAFAKFFSWLCPSKYIPGKQDGAAF